MSQSLIQCPTCQTSYHPSRVPGGLCPRCLMMGGVEELSTVSAQQVDAWVPLTIQELQALLEGYDILELIGRGGMGAVYKARQPVLDRLVAIKILPVLRDDMGVGFVDRFKNEARLMARMNHPGIVHVYEFGELAGGLCFLVMEFVDGTDVAQLLKKQGRLPPAQAASITADVCAALEYAHEAGVVHRDIKPANILVSEKGQVKVADFGLAKHRDPDQGSVTGTGLTLGTPDFAAPESLISGTLVDHRADLYAVGVMLYNMLTGEMPRGVFQPVSRQVKVHTFFDDVIRRAMNADREKRYQTAAAMKQEVLRAAKPIPSAFLRWGGVLAAAALLLLTGFSLRPVLLPHEAMLTERQKVERVAEWVFSKGGRLMVRSGTDLSTATTSAELPRGPLVIERLLFTSIKEPNLTITDAELALWLPLVPELLQFTVEDSPKLLRNVGERGLMELGRLLKLERLSLEHAPLTDDLLFYLAPFTQLKKLNVSNTRINGTGFAHVRRNFVWLEVFGCPINEAGWSEIREFKRLQGIKMSSGVAPSLPRDEDGYVCLPHLKEFLWPEKAP